jgi:hypothetical protein
MPVYRRGIDVQRHTVYVMHEYTAQAEHSAMLPAELLAGPCRKANAYLFFLWVNNR